MAKAKRDYNALNSESLFKENIAIATAEPEQLPGQMEIDEPKHKGNHATYTPQQIHEFQAQEKTQGRRGCKMQRLNISMTPEIAEYIDIMAAYRGLSKNHLVCEILAASMEKNADLFKRAAAEVDRRKEEFKL